MYEGAGDGTCSFCLSRSDWEAEHDDIPWKLDADRWECPHAPLEGKDVCIFHDPSDDKSATETANALYTVINEASDGLAPEESRRYKEFVGATFPGLSLVYAVLDADDNYPIDLRHSRVDGALNLRYAIVRHPISLDGSTVTGAVDCGNLEVDGEYVVLSDCVFDSGVDFQNAVFRNDVLAIQAEVGGNVSFHNARVGGNLELAGTTVEAGDDQRGNLTLAKATVEGDGGLSRLDLSGQLLMGDGRFGGSLWMKWSTFRDDIYFKAVQFEGDVRLEESTVDGVLSFLESTFEGSILLDVDQFRAETRAIDLRECRLESGTLSQPSEPVVFDLSQAVVGDLDLTAPDGVNPFDYLYVLQTRFDGFDFGKYTRTLAAREWALHELPTGVESPTWSDGQVVERTPENIENTYLKAKNGAVAVGEDKAAARLFREEMLRRRAVHWTTVRRAVDEGEFGLAARAVGDGIGNFVLGAVTKHGEGSWRVVGISVAIIISFVGVFAALWTQDAPPYGHPVGYLVLSIESFVTLVLGGSAGIRDPWLRLVANVEGFAGVFLVAVLVFTLTRSVHR